MLHKHHIIPRHAGGTDDLTNIIELTIQEHADAHRRLYEQYGRWQDKVAWQGLDGQIGKEEVIFLKNSLAHKGKTPMLGKRHTEKSKKKMGMANIGNSYRLGLKLSEDTKEKIRASRFGKSSWNKGVPMKESTKSLLRQMKLGVPNPKAMKSYQITYPDGTTHTVTGLIQFSRLNRLNAGNLLSSCGSKGYKAKRII